MALLLRLHLPLPEALARIAPRVARGRRRRRLLALAADTGAGMTLSQAMAVQPDLFGPRDAAIVAAAEARDRLPDTLAELGALHAAHRDLVRDLRAIFAYPALVLFTAVVVVQGWVFLFPWRTAWACLDLDQCRGCPLPAGMRFLTEVWPGLAGCILGVLAIVLALVLWSDRIHEGLLFMLGRRLHSAIAMRQRRDMAAICRALALGMRQAQPLPDALRMAADWVSHHKLRTHLQDLASAIHRGGDPGQVLGDSGVAGPLLPRCFADSGEDRQALLLEQAGAVYADIAEAWRLRATRLLAGLAYALALSTVILAGAGVFFLLPNLFVWLVYCND